MAHAQIRASTNGVASGTVLARPRVRVYTKPTWVAQWMPALFLRPLQATLAVAPLKSSASFEWLVGNVKYAGTNLFKPQHHTNLRDFFVRIELLGQSSLGSEPNDLWIGRIVENESDFHGVSETSNGSLARGSQLMTALGLEHELDRAIIRGSWITNNDTAAVFVDTPLRFNERFEGPSGLNESVNRSGPKVPHPTPPPPPAAAPTSYVFAGVKGGTVSPVQPWTVADICRYLFTFYCPAEMGLSLAGNVAALEQLVLPKVDLSGRTVFQALNHLIDRRRGLGWCLRHARPSTADVLAGIPGKMAVHVYSVFDEPVKFGDATIEPNGEKANLQLEDLHHLVDQNTLQVDTLGRYGKIVVSGERVLVCFTAKVDETLFPAWTAAEQTAYVTCDGGFGETPGTAAENDQARGDVRFDHVFSHFHLGSAPTSGLVPNAGGAFLWRTAGDPAAPGSGGCNPMIDETGRLKVDQDTEQPPIRDWGHRVERFLPFRTTKTVTDAEPEYERPFVLLLSGESGRWVMGHSTGSGNDAQLTPLDNHFGVAVEFRPHHRLAKSNWKATGDAAPTPTANDPAPGGDGFFGYGNMKATIAVRTDSRLQVTETIDKDGPLKDRVLHIEVPDAELHYAVPGTVKGVKPTLAEGDSNPLELVTAADSVIRDDGDQLRRIAAMARTWYGKERAVLALTVNTIWQQYPVGSLVLGVADKLRERAVNTPVSQVTFDLVNMKTTIRTNWSELDVTVGRSAGRRRT